MTFLKPFRKFNSGIIPLPWFAFKKGAGIILY